MLRRNNLCRLELSILWEHPLLRKSDLRWTEFGKQSRSSRRSVLFPSDNIHGNSHKERSFPCLIPPFMTRFNHEPTFWSWEILFSAVPAAHKIAVKCGAQIRRPYFWRKVFLKQINKALTSYVLFESMHKQIRPGSFKLCEISTCRGQLKHAK